MRMSEIAVIIGDMIMTDQILESFKKFLDDPDGWEFFITGQAGTGKTTYLNNLYLYALEQGLKVVACAHTHKACNILRSKLTAEAVVMTTHAYLKKRPSINEHAITVEHLNRSTKQGESESVDIIFIDEYSILGETDYIDLGRLQDPTGEGTVKTKIVYLGDKNQLDPVNDQQGVHPGGKYKHTLTKVWRQAETSSLLDLLCNLVTYIEGTAEPEPLMESEHFKRGRDLLSTYRLLEEEHFGTDIAILAYTNESVEDLNRQLAGKDFPTRGNRVFSPTTRKLYQFDRVVHGDPIVKIDRAFGDPLELNSKYKSLEHLINMNCCKFMDVVDEEDNDLTYAVIFGHYQYKLKLEELASKAVKSNTDIETQFNNKAKEWALTNVNHTLAKARSKAWRDYITFKQNVICMDFPYAMTVHKSQGSTFDYVLLDMQDLGVVANRNYTLYLKLLYVAISRASKCVYTN